MLNALKARVKNRLQSMVRSEVDRTINAILPQLLEFHNSPPEMRQSFHDHTRDPVSNYNYYVALRDHLAQLDVRVEDISVDVKDFKKWLKAYPEIESNYRDSTEYIEKCLEHYLSFTLLDLDSTDTFIDVASAGSPFADVLHKRIGLTAYRLDLSYPPGIHGHQIGADAGATGLPKEFATAMALHCAYEAFMGDADIRFVHEAARILKPSGQYIILPLYLDDTYFIATSPYCNQEDVVIDPGALKLWRDDSYRQPVSRHYSPKSFAERIYSQIPTGMTGIVYFLRNISEVWKSFEGQRVYCYFIFRCTKE
jgi:hypothetical protein